MVWMSRVVESWEVKLMARVLHLIWFIFIGGVSLWQYCGLQNYLVYTVMAVIGRFPGIIQLLLSPVVCTSVVTTASQIDDGRVPQDC